MSGLIPPDMDEGGDGETPPPPPAPMADLPLDLDDLLGDAPLNAIFEAPVAAMPPPVITPDPTPLEPEIVKAPPLRDAVLAGKFFGAKHQDTAAALAHFIVDDKRALESWFGPERAPALLADEALLGALIDRDLVALDEMIARQLDAILHHPRFKRLEGSWRGVEWLSDRIGISGKLKMRIFSASWAEICRDLERAAEFDRSQLFRAIYEDEFGTPGGEPYGFIVLDYEVRHRPGPGAPTDDISALASLSAIAAAAFSPMVVGAAPALLGVDHFAELSGVADPSSGFAAAEYQRWRSLGARDDIRFMSVALPRLMARLPWDEQLGRHRGFRYREEGGSPANQVWSNPGYAIAACVARAYEAYSWPADIRGYEVDRLGGGVVENLPEPMFSVDPTGGLDRPAVEIAFTDKQERALVAAALMPVSALPYGGQMLLGAARSLQTAAKKYVGSGAEAAAANTKLSAQFNTMVCVSRFAHYVKVMGRDMIGSFQTAPEIERFLQTWLMRYVNSDLSPGADTMARFPLRDASVKISELPGKPGVYGCIVQLQPHFQLDDISAAFRLVTELAKPKAA